MEAPAQRLKSFITSSKKKLLNRFYNIPIQYGHLFKTYKHALSGWSSLTKPANYYIGQFYYDTALSTGESTFASLKSNRYFSYFIWFRCTLCRIVGLLKCKNISESHYFQSKIR